MFRTKVSWKYRNKVGILVVIEIPRGFFQSLRAPANYFIHVICINSRFRLERFTGKKK